MCGCTVEGNITLTENLSCTNAGDALVVGANSITIDLGGYTIDGDDTNVVNGIDVGAFDTVTIQDGTIQDCTRGVYASGGCDNLTVQNTTLTSNTGDGIRLYTEATAITGATITGNTITSNGGQGVYLYSKSNDEISGTDILNNTISSNTVRGIYQRDEGGTATSYDTKIDGNTIANNTEAGITVTELLNTSGANEFSNNTITDNSSGATGGGMFINDVVAPLVHDNLVQNNHTAPAGIDGRGIYVSDDCTSAEIYRNEVSGHTDNSTPPTQSCGIAVTGNTAAVYCNIIYDNDAGICVGTAGAASITLYNNTIYSNDDRGISIQNNTDSSEVTIKNNILSTGAYGIYDDDAVNDPTEDHNCYHGNTTDDDFQMTKDGTSVNSDPLFMDATNSSFRLKHKSPCIDTGDNTAVASIPLDFNSRTRIIGSTVDIGAIEFRPKKPWWMIWGRR